MTGHVGSAAPRCPCDFLRFARAVLLVALSAELLLDGPWPRPHGWIFDRDLVREGLWPGARPVLNQVQVLARPLEIGFRTEVGHVDHKRVALPMAARVAEPLADVSRLPLPALSEASDGLRTDEKQRGVVKPMATFACAVVE